VPGDLLSEVRPELEIDLDAALAALPKPEREAVVLCHLNGMSRREAAAALGCNEGTLSSRLSRALTRLRRRFGKPPLALLAAATTVMLTQQDHIAAAPLVDRWRDSTFEDWLSRKHVRKGMDAPMRLMDCLGPAMTSIVAVMLIVIGWPTQRGPSSAANSTHAMQSSPDRSRTTMVFTPERFRKLIEAGRTSAASAPNQVDVEAERILADWETRRAGKQSFYAKFDYTIMSPGDATSTKRSGSLRFNRPNLGRIDFTADADRMGREILLWTATNEFWRFDVDSKTAANIKFERSALIDFIKQSEFVWLASDDKKAIQNLGVIQKVNEDVSQVVLRVLPVKSQNLHDFTSMTVHLRKPDLLPYRLIVQFKGGAEVTWEFSTVHEGIVILDSDFVPPKVELPAWHVARHYLRNKVTTGEPGK
jgi:hypothetical protein